MQECVISLLMEWLEQICVVYQPDFLAFGWARKSILVLAVVWCPLVATPSCLNFHEHDSVSFGELQDSSSSYNFWLVVSLFVGLIGVIRRNLGVWENTLCPSLLVEMVLPDMLCPLLQFLSPILLSHLSEREANVCLDLCLHLIVGVLHSCLSI